MSTRFKNLFLLFYFLNLFYLSNAQSPPNDKNWINDTTNMYLYDGFNGTTLDPAKWGAGLSWNDSAGFARKN